MKRKYTYTRIIAFALALLLALPVFSVPSAFAQSALTGGAGSSYDYYKDVYTQLKNTDSHVFKTLTYEDFVTLLDSEGTFAVLIGGAWSQETQADIGYINEVAKAYGISTIYNFDTKLDGKAIDINQTQSVEQTQAYTRVNTANTGVVTTTYFDFAELYVELVHKYLPNLTTIGGDSQKVEYTRKSREVKNAAGAITTESKVEGAGEAKQLQAPYLLVYNKDHKDAEGNKAPVVAYLEKHGANESYTWEQHFASNAGNVEAYKSKVKAVFDQAAAAGYAAGSYRTLDSWDFIAPAFNSHRPSGSPEIFPTKTVDGKTVRDDSEQNAVHSSLVFEHATYHELTRLLESGGDHVFLFGGSWCPNTQAEIRYINEYAKAHGIEKIYFWDTKLDAGISVRDASIDPHNSTFLQVRDNETAHPLAYLYGELVDTYLKNIQTTYNPVTGSASQKVIFTDAETAGLKTVNKLQVPYLFTYNKDHKDENGATAPILGHVEIMNGWATTANVTSEQYLKYEVAANDLFARLEAQPSGLEATAPSSSSVNDGSIAGVGARKLEYKAAGETAYTSVSGHTISGLAPGQYDVRYVQSKGYNTNYNRTTSAGIVSYAPNSPIQIVVPAYQAAPTGLQGVKPTSAANGDGKITIDSATSTAGLWYKLGTDGAAVSVPEGTEAEITQLVPGLYYFWYAAKEGYASSAQTEVIVPSFEELAPPTGLTAVHTTGLDNNDGQITGIPASDYKLQYKKQEDETYVDAVVEDGAIRHLTPGVYLVRYDADGEYHASQPVTLTVQGQQAQPTGLAGVAPTSALNDGRITGSSDLLEYRLKNTQSPANYTSAAGTAIAGLTAGTYEVRVKATAVYAASEPIEVVVPAYVASNPGSGSGGDGSSAPTPTTPPNNGVVTAPGTGNTEISSIAVPAKTDDATGETVAFIEAKVITSLVESSKKSADAGKAAAIELKVEPTETSTSIQLTIPKASFAELVSGTQADVIVNYGRIGTLRFDAKAIQTINGAADSGDISIIVAKSELTEEGKEVLGDRPVYDFFVFAGEAYVSGFGGGAAQISLPYTLKQGEAPEAVIVYYVTEEGELETVSGQFNAISGTVDFATTHFSQYIIGYNKVEFDDVVDTAWYAKAVGFLAARDITGGTDGSNFSPNAELTRGQFIVLLLKALGIEADESGADNFADAGNAYYTGYLAAAKKLGIATGIGDNRFAPNESISRQDLFTLLHRSLTIAGWTLDGQSNASIADFSDAEAITDYARTALQAFVENGVIAGSGSKLNPQANTTRAEVAQVLYKLLSK